MKDDKPHLEENMERLLNAAEMESGRLDARLRAGMYGRLVMQMRSWQGRPVFPVPLLLALAIFLVLVVGVVAVSLPGIAAPLQNELLFSMVVVIALMNLLSLPFACLLVVLLRRETKKID